LQLIKNCRRTYHSISYKKNYIEHKQPEGRSTMNCVLAVTVEVSEQAKGALMKIVEQHAMVNMRINLDESITISQGVEDNPRLDE
jgi:hypothetical protein